MKDKFYGNYFHTLDKKGRVSLPSKHRENLKGRVIVTRGPYDHFLWLFSEAGWERMVSKLSRLPNRLEVMEMRRYLIGSAFECDVDSLGRIQLPQTLRRHAMLEKDVVIIGVGECIELWDRARMERMEKDESGTGAMQQRMEKYRI
ncbi:MAG: division/cell wall cluster transcriptional repressor MraZ [bacterium]